MPHTLKIYGDDANVVAQMPGSRVVARYPAFTVVEVADDAVTTASEGRLTEDITDQYNIQRDGLAIDTAMPRINGAGATVAHPVYEGAPRLPRGPHHYILQFIGPIKQSWLTQARKEGAEIVAPYDGFAVIARLTPDVVAAVSKLSSVRWLGHLPYSARLSRHIREQAGLPEAATPRTRYAPEVYTLQFFQAARATAAQDQVARLGFEILEHVPGSEMLVVRSKSSEPAVVQRRLYALSRIHGVRRVAARPIRRTSNDRAAVIMGTAASLAAPPALGLSGEGEIIGVCDTGLDTGNPATIHPDFAGRIAAIKSYAISPSFSADVLNPGHDDGPADLDSGHGTHTSGSVLGDGTAGTNLPGLAGPIRGLAYRAKLVLQAVEQELKWKNPANLHRYGRFLLAGLPSDLTTIFSFAYDKGARVHSNSWGGGSAGSYDDQCLQVDRFVWRKPDFCILFAAGNDGRDGNANGAIDLGSVTPPGTAKNCITVGASENNRPQMTLTYGNGWPDDYPSNPIKSDRLANDPNDIAAFSSRGPTADGRVKPDIVAPGTYILSTRSRLLAPNNFGYGRFGSSTLYMFDSGTSMATPLTAGAVAIVREYLRKTVKIASPSAALLKAALIAGAQPVRPAAVPPDNNQGFGRVNLDNLLSPHAPLKAMFIEGKGLATGALEERTVTVAQGGQPLKIVLAYSDFPGPRLVNNLNLIVRGPTGAVLQVGNAGAGGSFDTKNNVELAILPQATAGNYRLQVVGSNVPNGPQPFALVVIGALGS